MPCDTDADQMLYRERVGREFDTLLCRAERKNRLFYLLNLFNGWRIQGPQSSAYFTEHINQVVKRLMLGPVARQENIPYSDFVLSLQLSMESKGFYATLRNFLYVILGEYAEQEPWLADELVTGGISTTRVVWNLVEEFRMVNCDYLADEFQSTHAESGLLIRNAIAHGNFAPPRPDTGGEWVFAKYSVEPSRAVTMEETRCPADEFNRICRQLLLFQGGFSDAVEHHQTKYKNGTMTFEAPNQSRPSELLRCGCCSGDIQVKFEGTPFWGIVGRVVFYLERNGYTVDLGESISAVSKESGRSCTFACEEKEDLPRIAGELAKHLDIDVRQRVGKRHRTRMRENN